MRRLSLLLISFFFTSSVFSQTKEFNCVFNKWFDEPTGTATFFKLTKGSNKYTDMGGIEYIVSFEDNEIISMVSFNKFSPNIDTVIINKKNKNITKSLTMDNLVTVIKGNCE